MCSDSDLLIFLCWHPLLPSNVPGSKSISGMDNLNLSFLVDKPLYTLSALSLSVRKHSDQLYQPHLLYNLLSLLINPIYYSANICLNSIGKNWSYVPRQSRAKKLRLRRCLGTKTRLSCHIHSYTIYQYNMYICVSIYLYSNIYIISMYIYIYVYVVYIRCGEISP